MVKKKNISEYCQKCKVKIGSKTPSECACMHKVNTKKIGQDGEKYIVKTKKSKNGKKTNFWARYKTNIKAKKTITKKSSAEKTTSTSSPSNLFTINQSKKFNELVKKFKKEAETNEQNEIDLLQSLNEKEKSKKTKKEVSISASDKKLIENVRKKLMDLLKETKKRILEKSQYYKGKNLVWKVKGENILSLSLSALIYLFAISSKEEDDYSFGKIVNCWLNTFTASELSRIYSNIFEYIPKTYNTDNAIVADESAKHIVFYSSKDSIYTVIKNKKAKE